MATITYIRQLEAKRGLFFQIGLTIALLIIWIALQLTFTYTIPDLKAPDVETEQIIFEIPVHKNNNAEPPVPAKTIVNKLLPVTRIVTTTEAPVIEKPIEVITPDNTEPVTINTSASPSTSEFIPPVFPEFAGGMESLYAFLKENLKYDKKAVNAGIAGTVYVNFRVDESGQISDIKVLRGIHPLLDAEAVRVVSIMPAWNPGRNYDGSPVACTFNLPISFKLK